MSKVNAELGDQDIGRDDDGEKAEPCANSVDATIAKPPPFHKQTSLAETLVSVSFSYPNTALFVSLLGGRKYKETDKMNIFFIFVGSECRAPRGWERR
jgi:hypothetical protein